MRFPFASTGLIGVQFTDGMVRAGVFERKGGGLHFLELCEREVSLKSLSADGDALLPQEASRLLAEQLASHRIARGTPCAVVIEPESVYTTVVSLPPVVQQKIHELVRIEVEKIVPEPVDGLVIRTRTLLASADEVRLGIAAVRTEALERALNIARDAGLRPVAVTTASAALSRFAPGGGREPATILLLDVPTAKDMRGTLTLFHRGWPIDEQLLLPPVSAEQIAEQTRRFVDEYGAGDTPVEHVEFAGNPQVEAIVREAMLVPFPTPSGGIRAPVAFERVRLPGGEVSPPWEAVAAVCAPSSGPHQFNLAPEARGRFDWKWAALGATALAVCGAVVGMLWFLPTSSSPSPAASSPPADCAQMLRVAAGSGATQASLARIRSACQGRNIVLPQAFCTLLSNPFRDVDRCTPEGHAAGELARLGIIDAASGALLHGEQPVSRAEAALLLLRSCPSNAGTGSALAPRFADLDNAAASAPALRQAAARGIIGANAAGMLHPDAGVTRAEFLKMLARACELDPRRYPSAPYPDVAAHDWFEPYARIAAGFGLFRPAGGSGSITLQPDLPVTRAAAVVAVYQYLGALAPGMKPGTPQPGSGTPASASSLPRPGG